jgi:hypothetical protein
MPSIKDFDKKKKKNHKKLEDIPIVKKPKIEKDEIDDSKAPKGYDLESSAESVKTQQRRPSKIDDAPKVDEPVSPQSEPDTEHEAFQSFSEPEPFELNFPGSFLIKAKVPKTFDLAEKIAGDWINDGKFEALPVGHPLAQILAAKALVKAKSLEKNVLNSMPITLAKIGLEYAKSKIKR